MKKFLLPFLIFAFATVFSQQEKRTPELKLKMNSTSENEQVLVWVFFTDKGNTAQQYFTNPLTIVSEKSLQRRAKVLPKNSLLNLADLPVNEYYVNEVLKLGLHLNQKSKWFNGISGYVQKHSLAQIEQLSFVKQLDIVYAFKKKMDEIEKQAVTPISTAIQKGTHSYNYGASFTQLNQINVPAVHDLGITGQGIWICMMDAGWSNLPHESFSQMTIHAKWDFVNHDGGVGDSTDMGEGSHGTETLSTIGGFKEGQLIGPAFGATFILAKTENTDSETPVEEDNWIAASEWADSIGVDVTSTSLGYLTFDSPYPSYTWQSMDGNTCRITIGADMAAARGIVVVNSAGNDGDNADHNTLGAPADGDSVISIGALNSDGSKASFSSVGPTVDGRYKPDVMAMGSGNIVASPTSVNSYTSSSGTSFSCPLSAGVAALILSANPTLTPIQVRDAMRNTASNSTSPNNSIGWGTLNALEAVNYFRVQISHSPLHDTEDPSRTNIISVNLTSHLDLDESQLFVFYSANSTTQFDSIPLTYSSGDRYEAMIPQMQNNTTVRYFVRAANSGSVFSYLPNNAPVEYFQFYIGTDVIPPIIIHSHLGNQSIFTWPPKISAKVTDNIAVRNVHVQYKHNGIDQNNFNLHRINGTDLFEARIPMTGVVVQLGDIFAYKIVALDSASVSNTTTLPNNGEFSFSVVNFVNYTSDFDSSNGNLTPSNDWQWGIPTSPSPIPNSAPNVWGTILNGDYTNGPLLSTLETPQLKVLDDNPTFSFYHWYNIEPRYDGGNVKFSVNGGPLTLISPVQQYDTILSSSFQNPLGGEKAFSGNSNGWKLATFNLSGYVNSGDNVVFSFQFGTDISITNVGWYIDDISTNGLGWIPMGVNEQTESNHFSFSLDQNYPNPFNPITIIRYTLQEKSTVTLKVFDMLGKEVSTIINNEEITPGKHQVQFDASNLSSGTYIYSLHCGNYTSTKKFVVLK